MARPWPNWLKAIQFLTLEETLQIHRVMLSKYGGGDGIRDIRLLESALAMPQSSFSGQYLHATLPEMAAAYSYHICQNHPFLDGNKRTALAAALVFLAINKIAIKDPKHKLYEAMMELAQGQKTKSQLAEIFRMLIKNK